MSSIRSMITMRWCVSGVALVALADVAERLLQLLEEARAVHQRAGAAVPFGKHENGFGRQSIDRFGELGPVLAALAGRWTSTSWLPSLAIPRSMSAASTTGMAIRSSLSTPGL